MRASRAQVHTHTRPRAHAQKHAHTHTQTKCSTSWAQDLDCGGFLHRVHRRPIVPPAQYPTRIPRHTASCAQPHRITMQMCHSGVGITTIVEFLALADKPVFSRVCRITSVFPATQAQILNAPLDRTLRYVNGYLTEHIANREQRMMSSVVSGAAVLAAGGVAAVESVARLQIFLYEVVRRSDVISINAWQLMQVLVTSFTRDCGDKLPTQRQMWLEFINGNDETRGEDIDALSQRDVTNCIPLMCYLWMQFYGGETCCIRTVMSMMMLTKDNIPSSLVEAITNTPDLRSMVERSYLSW